MIRYDKVNLKFFFDDVVSVTNAYNKYWILYSEDIFVSMRLYYDEIRLCSIFVCHLVNTV